MHKLSLYWRLMRFDKPIGIFLVLWPTLWGLVIAAQGLPSLKILTLFIIGTILMRAAGCVINDIADRKIDKFVTRTKARPITTGEISVKQALLLFFILLALALLVVLQFNRFTILLAIIGALLTLLYPFTKRFFIAPQLFLSFAFAWGIPMAFAAVLNTVPLIAWVLYLSTMIWIMVYDTQYAMVDREDDRKLAIHSTALWFGNADRLIIGILQALLIVLWVSIGAWLKLNFIYYLCLALIIVLFVYQQGLIKHRQPARCFKAFLNNNWVGLALLIGFIAGKLMLT